jgi:hypothetical protein
MSFRDIGAILNKADEAHRKEQQQRQDLDNNVSDKTANNNKNSSNRHLYLHKLTSFFLKEKVQLR